MKRETTIQIIKEEEAEHRIELKKHKNKSFFSIEKIFRYTIIAIANPVFQAIIALFACGTYVTETYYKVSTSK